jgi:superoxide dismutase, Cu-Zn family
MLITKGATVLAVGSLVCIALSGLRSPAVARQDEKKAHAKEATISKAVAILLATKGNKVEGRVTFTQAENGVQVKGEISGLTPGEHGFHVHEFGVWSPDGKAAGSHFNPTAQKHGEREATKRHVGDLGNIKANENGNAVIDLVDPHLTFHGPHSIIGRGLVVHEKADDYSQPVGNAGGRVAVGVIGVAQP